MVINGGGKFQQWTASGALATFAWVLVLVVYCAFRAFGIEDPIIGQAFLLLTGLWVGNLTIAQGKKQAKIEEKADRAEKRVDELKDSIQTEVTRNDGLEEREKIAKKRADDAEDRESGWSQHRDHYVEGDGGH